MKICIIIAAHKKYRMPTETCYLPVHVGCEGKESIGLTGDNTGDNISLKNPFYCELTGLYWMWKNIEADYMGLVHYRRYFTAKCMLRSSKTKLDRILKEDELKEMLKTTDIILPRKRHYYIESLYSHYAHTHYAEHLEIAEKVIKTMTPDYADAFRTVMQRRSGHMFNMFIMKSEMCKEYCKWLFSVLEEMEKHIDITQYDAFQARLYGRISELLLDVWIEKNGFKYKELPILNMEQIAWRKKAMSFFAAKFLGKKYKGSF